VEASLIEESSLLPSLLVIVVRYRASFPSAFLQMAGTESRNEEVQFHGRAKTVIRKEHADTKQLAIKSSSRSTRNVQICPWLRFPLAPFRLIPTPEFRT
jgi:hypothetical protein